MTKRQIEELVAALDLRLDAPGLCRACLHFVSSKLDDSDLEEARLWARRMTPNIWAEGFGEHARALVERAALAGVPHADEALRDLADRASRSPIARAMVMRLAAAQAVEDRAWRIARLN